MARSWKGEVTSLHITAAGSQELASPTEVKALPGKGLEGDRYALGTGFYSEASATPAPDREITLIEAEALDALLEEAGIEFSPAESRRNVVTRGVPLNHLVGRRFLVGAVPLEGVRLCEPCAHLVELTGKAVLGPLVHRGGLRARILAEGMIRIGDIVTPETP